MILGCLQLLLQDGVAPEVALNRLNQFIHSKSSGKFATMFVCSLSPDGKGKLRQRRPQSGLHLSRVRRRDRRIAVDKHGSGRVRLRDIRSFAVGAWPAIFVFVYSDGLTEAENVAGEMFGEERVKEIIRREGTAGATGVHEALIASIAQFTR